MEVEISNAIDLTHALRMWDGPYGFILGRGDAEMLYIERTLRVRDIPYAWAPAVVTDSWLQAKIRGWKAEKASSIMPVFVECSGTVSVVSYVTIDHHGDCAQAQFPPSQYWEGSSVGQVFNLLGLEATTEARIIAALDHCKASALRGLCPGVSSDDAREWLLGRQTLGPLVRAGFLEVLTSWVLKHSLMVGPVRLFRLNPSVDLSLIVDDLYVVPKENKGWFVGGALPDNPLIQGLAGLEGWYGSPARGYAGTDQCLQPWELIMDVERVWIATGATEYTCGQCNQNYLRDADYGNCCCGGR